MEQLLDLLRKIRGVYVKRLESELGELHRAHGSGLKIQPLFEGKGDALPVRFDAVIVEGGKVEAFDIQSATMLQFQPVVIATRDAVSRTLTIGPFPWDQAHVVLTAADPSRLDLEPLRASFLKWIRPPDGDAESTSEPVVHSMSEPALDAGGLTFSLDLGTAPAEAAHDLFTACLECGASTVTVR